MQIEVFSDVPDDIRSILETSVPDGVIIQQIGTLRRHDIQGLLSVDIKISLNVDLTDALLAAIVSWLLLARRKAKKLSIDREEIPYDKKRIVQAIKKKLTRKSPTERTERTD